MGKINLCKCNNCDSILIDTNPQVGASLFTGNIRQLDELVSVEDMRACPKCNTDEYLTDTINYLEIPNGIHKIP
jgi:hypothetical protein